jgi:hypothetical protein
MAVAPGGSAGKSALFIPHAVRMGGNAAILQGGATSIGGNFYQDALTNVFSMSGGNFVSQGKIVFFRNNGAGDAGARRYVTTRSGNIDAFDRGQSFVAFPEIEIRTKDTLVIPARMGIDALKLVRNDNSYGKLLLESKTINGGDFDRSYDASLRITGAQDLTSAELVPPGAVIVERDLTPYREADGEGADRGMLFAFASPFKQMRSAYFAGNWVRKMLEEENGHVEYVYANEGGADNTILTAQYIINPYEEFIPGKAYLVRLRPSGFDYTGGSPLLLTSGGDYSDYDRNRFVFDGKPYRLGAVDEQLFADNILFDRTVSIAAGKTHNWLIGNSFTAPIDVQKLVDVMGASSLSFERNIYIFPLGSVGYQAYQVQLDAEKSMNIVDLDEIPSMSYFMIRLSRNSAQNGSLTLRRNEILTHGKASHTLRSAGGKYSNEAVFRVSPAARPGIYDLAGIGLRRDGNPGYDANDILKTGNSDESESFSLYFLSEDGQKLSAGIVPENASKASLCFSPGRAGGRFNITVSRMESLKTQGLWLEDTKEGIITDLFESGGSCDFEASPEDAPGRFVVRFQPPEEANTGDSLELRELRVFPKDGRLIIQGLASGDTGARLLVYDARGQLLREDTVTQIPEMDMPAPAAEGIYVFRMEGARSITLKFRK